jgi:metal-responsive CopG/Arc/MetJ family transcriptional regulator
MQQHPKPRGRPSVGSRVSVRLPADLLARVDARAAAIGESRASVVRDLLADALGAAPPLDGVDRAQIRRMLALTPRERIRYMADVANGMIRLRERMRAGTA